MGGFKAAVALVFGAMFTFFAPPALANDLRLNVIVEVAPGGASAFENAWATLRDAAAAEGYPYYTVVSQSGAHLRFLSVMKTYEALKTIAEFRQLFEASDDPELSAALEILKDNVVSYQTYISNHDLTLSYAPEGSYAGPYHRLQTFEYPAARAGDIAAAFEILNAAWSAAEIPSAFHVMWHGVGAEGGKVTMMTSASTPEEHAKIEADVRAQTSEGYQAFDAALWGIVTASKVEYWTSRPELTLRPAAP